MAKWRDVYIARDEVVADTQTKIFDIDITDPISQIDVIYQADNGATSNAGHPIHKDVSAIELVDGSDVLWSMSMPLAEALNFYESGRMPPAELTEVGGATQKESAQLNFGRWLGDDQFAFDPTKFRNPQLRLTHALTISATAGFATGTGKVTVIAKVLEEPRPTPAGFLTAKSIYSWTTAASGEEVIDIPRDYPLRLLLLRAYESGTAMTSNVVRVKLSCDADKFIPLDLYSDDWISLIEKKFGHAQVKNVLKRADGALVETFLGVIKAAALNVRADLNIGGFDALAADTITTQVIVLTTTPTVAKQTAAQTLDLYAEGLCPHNTYAYAFGDPAKPETWLPLPTFKDVKLKVTQGDAGAAANVVLQQWRGY